MDNKDDSLTKNFGVTVRELRQQLGYSQEMFAQLCELHRTYIGAIERGEKNVTLVTARKIAETLGISLSVLISHAEQKLSEADNIGS